MNLPSTISEARLIGSKLYFTGKPCKFGNVAPRLTSAGICRCKECLAFYSKRAVAQQKRNPEKIRARNIAWRQKNAEWVTAYGRDYKEAQRDKDRAAHFRRSYGLTIESYNLMFEAQGGKCRLCLTPADQCSRKRLFVDHCHGSKKVRGLLCDTCNKSLGVIEKYRDKIPSMLAYADGQPPKTPTTRSDSSKQ